MGIPHSRAAASKRLELRAQILGMNHEEENDHEKI
jgi:hypothetical protein